MAVKSKGLGRGLDTLIPEKKSIKSSQKSETSKSAEKQEPQNGELMMKINMVEPNRDQPRKNFEEDALLEYARYVENYYGTPRSYVEEQLQAGRNVILEIEIQGAMKIKEKIPEALLVFVTPPTVEELERRLTGRGTETAQVIADRLARAGEEAEGMGQYDYILVNDTVEECVDHLHQIIVSEHSRVSRNAEFIADIQKQTKAFQK